MCSYYNSCFLKKDCSDRNNCGTRLHDGDLEPSLMKEKNSYVIVPIFMFSHSRYSFRNLKDTLYSIYSKSLLFTSISYVQESFKLSEVNHG